MIAKTKSILLQRLKGALVVVLCVYVAGCGFEQAKKDAEKVINRHFQTISTNGYDNAMTDYGAQFFSRTSKEEWSKMLARGNEKLGTFQSYGIISWSVNQQRTTMGNGTYVKILCQTIYSKYSAQEQFMLFKGFGDRDFKIIGHQINSEGLLKE